MKYKWKLSDPSLSLKEEKIENVYIKLSDDGEALVDILNSLQDKLLSSDKLTETYILEIPKELLDLKKNNSFEEEVLFLSARKIIHFEGNDFIVYWTLNIFKNYRPYRNWIHSHLKCKEDVSVNYNRPSSLEFEELLADFFKFLKLKGFS